MVFATPMPSAALLSAYNADYFSEAHGGKPSNRLAVAFFSGIARIRQAFVSFYLRKHGIFARRVLEVGPGPGYFARSWLQAAPKTTYLAVEKDKSCHRLLSELGVRVVNFADVDSVDLVVMSHVVEHVADPVDFVRAATRALNPGGALFVEVPCQDWAHKSIDEPHVLFFDKVSMRRLLDQLGFVDIEIAYFGQTIAQLKKNSIMRSVLLRIRAKLIGWGLVVPFSMTRAGMEPLGDPLERAMVAPLLAHRESSEPAWWLRAVARKP